MDARKTPQLLLETWFGELNPEGIPTESRRIERWFKSTTDFDRQLKWLFEKDLLQAQSTMAPLWQTDSQSWLAYILLMDQIPRNIFRGTAKAFSFDDKALSACLTGLDKALDTSLTLSERLFFYMPLQHSETKELQQLSVEKFEGLVRDAKGEKAQGLAEQSYASAQTHQRIIEQFNRFPHRNVLLARQNTPAEAWFLDTTQNRFGQNG